MKKYLLILGVISMVILTACAQQSQPAAQPAHEREIAVIEPAGEMIKETKEETAVEEPGSKAVPPTVEPKDFPAKTSLKEFNMIAKQWDFEPSTIFVTEGDRVKLNVKSVDVTHGISLAEFGINERLSPGKTVTVEFTADRAGEYIFSCSVPCGKGHGGMRGTLVVE